MEQTKRDTTILAAVPAPVPNPVQVTGEGTTYFNPFYTPIPKPRRVNEDTSVVLCDLWRKHERGDLQYRWNVLATELSVIAWGVRDKTRQAEWEFLAQIARIRAQMCSTPVR